LIGTLIQVEPGGLGAALAQAGKLRLDPNQTAFVRTRRTIPPSGMKIKKETQRIHAKAGMISSSFGKN